MCSPRCLRSDGAVTSGGRVQLAKAKNGTTCSQALRQAWPIADSVCGNTEVMDSGKPLRPSDNGDQVVIDAAGFELIDHVEPEFGALGLFDPKPKHALLAVWIEGQRHIDGLVLDQALIADFDPQSIKKDDRIHPIERPVLPFPYLIKHRIRDPADEVRRNLGRGRTKHLRCKRSSAWSATARRLSTSSAARCHSSVSIR
jgi:hypothetical protein